MRHTQLVFFSSLKEDCSLFKSRENHYFAYDVYISQPYEAYYIYIYIYIFKVVIFDNIPELENY